MDDVLLRPRASSSLGEPHEARICGVCLTQPSKYGCPRCPLKYCSLACFKSEAHADCSEEFYKVRQACRHGAFMSYSS